MPIGIDIIDEYIYSICNIYYVVNVGQKKTKVMLYILAIYFNSSIFVRQML